MQPYPFSFLKFINTFLDRIYRITWIIFVPFDLSAYKQSAKHGEEVKTQCLSSSFQPDMHSGFGCEHDEHFQAEFLPPLEEHSVFSVRISALGYKSKKLK